METIVFCKKYQEELPAMSFPPLPGQAGKDLMETVSQKAFDAWKLHQTTLINERRLDLSIAENRTFLIEEMHKFFDNKEVAQAEGFVDPNKTLDNVVQSYQPPLSDNK
jgi:Fe-S cluster biosynthesis and repair protein YggX